MSRIHENEVQLNGGRILGRLTLDNPKALNAVRLDMIEPMLSAIHAWEARPEVVAILRSIYDDLHAEAASQLAVIARQRNAAGAR